MAFNAKAVNIGTTNTTVFECPATLSGSVHGLVISNNSAAIATLTLRYFDKSEGTTTIIRNIEVAAKGEFTFSKPINVTSGDQIIASASTAGALVAFHSVYLSTEAPVTTGFTGRGEWAVGAAYAINDVVVREGSSYLSLAVNTGSAPPSVSWMMLASKGDGSGIQTVNGVAPDGNGEVTLPNATIAAAGLMAHTDKSKLDGIEAGATANSTDANLKNRANHTGTQAASTISDLSVVATSGQYSDLLGKPAEATSGAAGLMSSTDKTKLNGIATNATANDTDANLKSRANHTGTQAATTITGLHAVATSGAYGDLSGKPTIPTIPGNATTDTAGLMSAGDKSKLDGVSTGATANDTDANLKNRANHTGSQAINTVTDLQTTLDAKLASTGGVATGLKQSLSALGNISGATSINLATAGKFTATLTDATVLSFTNPPAAGQTQVILLRLTNAGAFNLDWPAGTQFVNKTKEGLTAAGTDSLGLEFDPVTGVCTVYVLGLNVGVAA